MSSEEENRVFIGGLSRSTTPAQLAKIFCRFGRVLETEIAVDRITGLPRGFGFVQFSNPKSVHDAIINMDDSYLFGRSISVCPAYPRTPNYTHNNLYYRPSCYNCGGTGHIAQNCNEESESSNESEYDFDPFGYGYGYYFDESDEFDESRYDDYTKFCDICKDFGHFIIHCPDWASSGRSMCNCDVGPLYDMTLGGYCIQCSDPRDPNPNPNPNPKKCKPKNSKNTGGSSQSPKSEEFSEKPAGGSSVKSTGGSSEKYAGESSVKVTGGHKNFKAERKSSPDLYNGMFNKKYSGVRGTGTSKGAANTGGSSLGPNNEKLENKSGGTRASGEKPTVVSSGKPTGGPTEKPTGGASEKPTGGSIEKTTGGPTEKSTVGTSEKVTGGCSRCRRKGIRLGRRRGKQGPVNVFVFVQRGENCSKKVICSILGLSGAMNFAGL